MGAEGTDLWCTCGVCLSASVLSAREGVREGSLRVLQLGRCGAGGIEGTARILRPCFLCARGGGLHVVSCCSVRGTALSILALLILDEPTNYLDRDSLGALADAIDHYEGGIIMITHNDAFCSQLCPERWVLEAGRLNTEGDVEWMTKAANEAVEFEKVDEMLDASGNVLKAGKKKLNAKEKKKMTKLLKQKIADGEELDEDEEAYAIEWNL